MFRLTLSLYRMVVNAQRDNSYQSFLLIVTFVDRGD